MTFQQPQSLAKLRTTVALLTVSGIHRMTALIIVLAYAETYAIRNQFTLVPIAAKHVRNSTVKAYVHSTFLHIVLCWINRLMFALVVQMRRHAKETMPTTLLIGRTLNTSKN